MDSRLVEDQMKIEPHFQKSSSNDVAMNALDSLLTAAGFDVDDLQIALEAIQSAKKQSINGLKDNKEYRNYLEKD